MAAAMSGLRSGMKSFTSAAAPARRVMPVAARPMTVSLTSSPSCSFLGGSSRASVLRISPARGRGSLVVVANNAKSMGCTKEGTNRHRRRTSGFRTRMQSPNGRKVLAARRKKGRANLCPASEKKSGGKK